MFACALWRTKALMVVPWRRPRTSRKPNLCASDLHSARTTILNTFKKARQLHFSFCFRSDDNVRVDCLMHCGAWQLLLGHIKVLCKWIVIIEQLSLLWMQGALQGEDRVLTVKRYILRSSCKYRTRFCHIFYDIHILAYICISANTAYS